jgi:type I restriction enzyme M protein
MSRKRDVLEQLKRDELVAAVDRLELPIEDRRSKTLLVEALASSRKAGLPAILADLSRDRLKELCRALGLDDSGRDKARIIARLAGEAPPMLTRNVEAASPVPKTSVSPRTTAPLASTPPGTQPRASQPRRTMAIKKSELYSSIWQSCDALRGGMDASQYKDYVLAFLFIKYISDKYAGQPFAPIKIAPGASFADMAALKGNSEIGDLINKRIIAPLVRDNQQLSQSDFPDFNDAVKLGSGKDMVDRLTELIGIFENPVLDFSRNRADGDDILGDAYEYLMRHFATESGKSKGQFYTPAEVSRVIAKILGIRTAKTSASTTVYDPTCGSGSLLLKVADEAGTRVTIYGQEKDATTSGLARMNMILHNQPGAVIAQGNSLANPRFTENDQLKTFDYVVANPPFSDKRWSSGLHPSEGGSPSGSGEQSARDYHRFEGFGIPPARQGDYAYLLHIVRSLKPNGKGACILPHGVLFRGNAEGEIRRALVRKGYIKGIIGLPANLFYGTGIPACIVVIDKEDAQARKGIFMIDASGGFLKDGPKNRLREMDIHRIVDVFIRQLNVPKYARMVSHEEIEKNEYNLNLPRYIDSQTPEDLQDIEGHLHGGIPESDIEALDRYWTVCPQLRHALFKPLRPGYVSLAVEKSAIKSTIYEHPEFTAFIADMNAHFAAWREERVPWLKTLDVGCHPKQVIVDLAESLLTHYTGKPLIDRYDIYQHLMDYWAETMQDDCYIISTESWKAETYRVIEKDKKGKEKDKGWTCDLIPKALIVAHYFAKEQAAVEELASELDDITSRLTKLEEEHSGEDGVFADLDPINRASVTDQLNEIKDDQGAMEDAIVLSSWLTLKQEETDLKKRFRAAEAVLNYQTYTQYPKITESEAKTLVVEGKWLATLGTAIHDEIDLISQQLTRRVKELTERYEIALSQLTDHIAELEAKVNHHLGKIPGGFAGERRLVSMRDILTQNATYGIVTAGKFVQNGIKMLRSGDIAEGRVNVELPMVSREKAAEYSRTSLIKNDVVIALVGYPGASARIPDDLIGANISRAVGLLRLNGKVSADYVVWFLNSPDGRRMVLAPSAGSAQQVVNLAALNKLQFTIPPLSEQVVIAGILTDIDAEIAALEAKLAKARQIKQGMMQKLLSGGGRPV